MRFFSSNTIVLSLSPICFCLEAVPALRSLYGQFVYRLDTNYAKIDRIEHKEIEKFKTHVLNTDFHGMTIKQWSNIFSSKDEAKLEYALKTLL